MVTPLEWLTGYAERHEETLPDNQSVIQTARYSLRQLGDRGLLPAQGVNGLLISADLDEFTWWVTWADEQLTPDESLATRIAQAEGIVIFIHGWAGSHAIWEDMPLQMVHRNRKLVTLNIDFNGFGATPFADRMPEYKECSPAGAMRGVERWLNLLNLRREPGNPHLKTVNFVGHSMGGAALFFLDESQWRLGEVTRTALAPALLLHDDLGRTFYTALGFGIGLVGRLRVLESIEQFVKPGILDTLANGASDAVFAEHRRIYDQTPRSVTARTFAAMGTISDEVLSRNWELMQIHLGHKDPLVSLPPILDTLYGLGFESTEIKVLFGTHYFFSAGEEWKRAHTQNREIVIADILSLHEQGLLRQRRG